MTDYALFHNGERISKAHSTWVAAMIEAYERGVREAIRSPDFSGGRHGTMLVDGYEVKPVEDDR